MRKHIYPLQEVDAEDGGWALDTWWALDTYSTVVAILEYMNRGANT